MLQDIIVFRAYFVAVRLQIAVRHRNIQDLRKHLKTNPDYSFSLLFTDFSMLTLVI